MPLLLWLLYTILSDLVLPALITMAAPVPKRPQPP